jgi:histidinol-phosphate aminotransferase
VTQVVSEPELSPSAGSHAPLAPTVAPNIARLVPYKPGKPVEEVERELGITGLIKLASNENPLGPSPKAQEAIRQMAAKMHIYPDADSHDLRHALAAHLDVDETCLAFGNGSDDIIHLLGVTFLEPGDEVIQADPSFVRYEAAAVLNDVACIKVPLTPDWTHDLETMAERITDRTRLVFIANPNNPTGTIITEDQLTRFLDRVPERVLTVVDEAYYEYAVAEPEYPTSLNHVREERNVVVLRTFSKAFGLAGLRLGYGVARPEIIHWLERTREPFNVNQMAQAAGIAALADTEFVAHTVATNEQGKRDLYAAFQELGLAYTPTFGNFVWVDVGRSGRAAYEALLRRGVIVRYSDGFGGPTHLRVSIGAPAENARFIQALRDVLSALP